MFLFLNCFVVSVLNICNAFCRHRRLSQRFSLFLHYNQTFYLNLLIGVSRSQLKDARLYRILRTHCQYPINGPLQGRVSSHNEKDAGLSPPRWPSAGWWTSYAFENNVFLDSQASFLTMFSFTVTADVLPTNYFDERNKDHWRSQAQWTLRSKISTPFNTKVAKNVILFLGDGMSITTLAATRAYLGQKYGRNGEEVKLSFETFPFTGLAKTYCVDHNVADSACSGTAYLTGVKANSGTVGLSAAVKRGDCDGQRNGANAVTGLMDWAQKAGKATGVVTTTRVTHATPAASYAHAADRRWEADADLPTQGLHCDDIAMQLVRGLVGSKIDIILGGGRKNFFSKTQKDIEGYNGHRNDKSDLIREWLRKKESMGARPKYVYNRQDLLLLDEGEYDSVLGLFSPDHMPYNLEAEDDDPRLSEMTQKAIKMLSQNQNGFFLFVEGGRIDTAHHETKARKALDETAEFAKAVEAALRLVDLEETLIVVTADHSHTMSYSGYSKRGSDILGFVNSKSNASDNLPYTTLSYANGPGYKPHEDFQRHNLLLDDMNNLNFTYPALVPIPRETHGGEDVAVFAKGPWSHLFTGNYEQNFIPHAIAYAACIGPGLTKCKLS